MPLSVEIFSIFFYSGDTSKCVHIPNSVGKQLKVWTTNIKKKEIIQSVFLFYIDTCFPIQRNSQKLPYKWPVGHVQAWSIFYLATTNLKVKRNGHQGVLTFRYGPKCYKTLVEIKKEAKRLAERKIIRTIFKGELF